VATSAPQRIATPARPGSRPAKVTRPRHGARAGAPGAAARPTPRRWPGANASRPTWQRPTTGPSTGAIQPAARAAGPAAATASAARSEASRAASGRAVIAATLRTDRPRLEPASHIRHASWGESTRTMPRSSQLEPEVDALYGLRPGEFVAARDELA